MGKISSYLTMFGNICTVQILKERDRERDREREKEREKERERETKSI